MPSYGARVVMHDGSVRRRTIDRERRTNAKDALNVSVGTINAWVKDITESRRRERDAKAWWLGVMGRASAH